jgi:transcriptional regulator
VREPGPAPRAETLRQAILAAISGRWLSPREISGEVRIRERDVAAHLEHLERSLRASGARLRIDPPACRSCGYVFAPGTGRPSRCPECKGERISAARFCVEQ